MIAEDSGTAFENQNITSLGPSNDGLDLTPIQKFYDGTNVFITGSTGFLGRLLVEKLLRSCPTISSLYLLVRKKKGKSMEERVDEMFDDTVFSRLKRECPKYRQKVVGIGGDCSLPDLGINLQDRKLLIDEINIVFHVAATVRFDEAIKTAVAINIRGSQELLNLSREMEKLKSYIHVSTIYGNSPQNCIEEKIYPPAIDGKKLMLFTENAPENILDDIVPRLLGDYPNTYAFTKQIAEDTVRRESENMPVGIFRPSIVISTYKEPLKAWINNMYGPTGVAAGIGVGILRVIHGDSFANANLVPADMCVNSLIASSWHVEQQFQKASNEQNKFEIPVYNYESSKDQPITWRYYLESSVNYGMSFPTEKAIWYYTFNMYPSYRVYLVLTFLLHTIPAILADTMLFCIGKSPRLVKAYEKIHKFSAVISYFALRSFDLKSNNVRHLLNEMSERDRDIFFSDLKKLDWDEYAADYFKGIRTYLIQDPMESLKKARRKWNRLYYAHQAVKLVLILLVLQALYCSVRFCLRFL